MLPGLEFPVQVPIPEFSVPADGYYYDRLCHALVPVMGARGIPTSRALGGPVSAVLMI
jgi:hypothetical protein